MENSPVIGISTWCDLSNQHDTFSITLRRKDDQTIKLIQRIASSAGITTEGGVDSVFSTDLAHFGQFCTQLLKAHLINAQDKKKLSVQIAAVEEIVRNRITTIPRDHSLARFDTFTPIASPCINALVKETSAYSDIVYLLYCLLSRQSKIWESHVKWQGESSVASGCIDTFWRILLGDGEGVRSLASGVLRNRNGSPILEHVRRMVIEETKQAFESKYGTVRKNVFESLYLDRALQELVHHSVWERRSAISRRYHIPWGSAFPEQSDLSLGKLCGIDEAYCFEKRCVPNVEEAQLLKRYGLERFPKSLEDWPSALSRAPGAIITDTEILMKLIDGTLYCEPSREQQMYNAIRDNDCAELERLFAPAFRIGCIGTLFSPRIDREFVQFEQSPALTPLRLACELGKADAAKTLIGLGADVNRVSSDGSTCLHGAAQSQDAQTIRYLLSSGAIFTIDKAGITPLHLLFSRISEVTVEEKREMIRLLLLMRPHGMGDLDTLKDTHGMNSLHIAAKVGDGVGIKALLLAGASPSIQTADGRTALDLIASDKNSPLKDDGEIRYLLSPT